MKWVIIALFAIWLVPVPFMICSDIKAFNRGICKCGNRLRHFDNDSQGGQGWCCDKCGRVVWISWIKGGDGDG